MAFIWIDKGPQITSEIISELKQNLNLLSNDILSITPVSSKSLSWGSTNSEAKDNLSIRDAVADEAQSNLDILKSENYCRGYHGGECASDNTSQHISYDNVADSSVNSAAHYTYNATEDAAVDANKFSTVYATYHGAYFAGDYGNNYVAKHQSG